MAKNTIKLSVLMLHALYADDTDWGFLTKFERPYAIPADRFRHIIELSQKAGVEFLTPKFHTVANKFNSLITFDDGHTSNYWHAAPILQENGLQGLFFVTIKFIEERNQFCDWQQLRELHAAGHSIQSHGLTHQFLTELSSDKCQNELVQSKQIIEEKIGAEVTDISFPGGRFGERELDLARAAGFRRFFTSKFGIHKISSDQVPQIFDRLPIRHQTTASLAAALCQGDGALLMRMKGVAATKNLVRKVIGNNAYHRLYKLLK